jgi:hypothetical protein
MSYGRDGRSESAADRWSRILLTYRERPTVASGSEKPSVGLVVRGLKDVEREFQECGRFAEALGSCFADALASLDQADVRVVLAKAQDGPAELTLFLGDGTDDLRRYVSSITSGPATGRGSGAA